MACTSFFGSIRFWLKWAGSFCIMLLRFILWTGYFDMHDDSFGLRGFDTLLISECFFCFLKVELAFRHDYYVFNLRF